jgi:predicted anti-sigma-YlaC factor YlaD
MYTRAAICERTARFVSLELDGELSRFECLLLERHLRSCPSCAADAATVAEVTRRVRAAPLEPLPAPVVITRPRRRVGYVAQRVVALAAVAVAAVWLGLSTGERAPAPNSGFRPSQTGPATAAAGLYDWPAGLPRAPKMIQLVPGGLYTSGVGV